MFFLTSPWMKGAIQSAESVRRSQAGTIAMACFIDTASGYWQNIPDRLETLGNFNNVLRALLIPMAFIAPWAVWGYEDLIVGHD